jgi:hypothetical protein
MSANQNIYNLINQISDPAAREAIKLIYEDHKTVFEGHTHNADGSETGSYFTSPPRTDAATVSAGTPSEL